MLNISDRIKMVRKSNKLNQKEFANILGISQTHVSKIEAGKDKPSTKLIKTICSYFKVSQWWLENNIGNMTDTNDDKEILEKDCLIALNKFLSDSSETEKMLLIDLISMLTINIKKIDLARFYSEDGYDGYIASVIKDIISEVFEYLSYLNTSTTSLSHDHSLVRFDDIFYVSNTHIERISEQLEDFINLYIGHNKTDDSDV